MDETPLPNLKENIFRWLFISPSGFSALVILMADFRHLALLIGLLTTNGAFPDLIFQHGIIGGASAAKLLPGKDMPDIDQGKGQEKKKKNDR